MKLPLSFYLQADVVKIAKELIGKFLYTSIDGNITGGIITETEAYMGETDKASHSYGGRRTRRTEIMYEEGGRAYIYLCYGIHSLFNVVTNKKNIPPAVLIRSIFPIENVELMVKRREMKNPKAEDLCNGPGKVSESMGIHFSETGKSLMGNEIWIEDKGLKISSDKIIIGPRIGIDYAGEDARLPYRFHVPHKQLDFLHDKVKI